ncbi:molybdenum ABC transporter ATP-binding protein [Arthrobacter sp. ERGS1:01]|uniref:sulfate/molybdate ABC transporter ATP-binding protein n=1 Tax=Arthrobacter sp. ERGS1:01 TaxID=1704044 RepID=UPI0006B49A0E|nr:ATP-binding cassette domain-containing protein [Arthrobacter sp. ERGS1:01]ALE06704.1 molybdenum ABC transporter ATP-binding protein [Arthrobacter sp. ERGS1:01]
MTLEFSAALAARNLELELRVGPAETVAVMGPNGAGKSSVVQILAGLLKPDSGAAALDGRALFRSALPSVWLPPHERGIGLLAQDSLLFPHLSVLENVAFGPRSQGRGRHDAAEAARHWLREVGTEGFAARKPAQLSGGQAQRVALARALATDPELLLLDEPMAALDVNSAPFLRSLLKRVLAGRRAIIVTHDVLDALMLADRIIVMEHGRIVEEGPTAAVLAHPRSAFAASLAGLNVLTGTLSGATVLTSDAGLVTGRLTGAPADGPGTDGPLGVPAGPDVEGGQDGMAAFPPSAVSVFLSPPQGSPRNCFAATVTELEPHGDHIRVRAGRLAADISPAATAELGLIPGSEVFFVVKAAEVAVYPA